VAEGDAKLPDGFDSLQELKQETLLEEARNRTKQEHSTETQERLLEQSNTLKESTQELTREKASQEQELANLQASEEKATTFRKSAAAFKWLQTQLRETAAEHFGEKILKLHQQLSGGNELTSVRIDSKNYMMHVKSKGFKTESPAHLFQGGGQCVMLGIAFKLALAQWLGNVSFLLLDEPTDGLDSKHLQTVLEGLAECPATKQILMITHVPWDLFDRYALLVNFESISKIALGNELTPELFKVHMEKKILTSIKTALDGDPSINKWFPGNTGWKPLDQLLTLHRLKELKSVGITRRGGRGKSKTFDVSTLAATYFGKQILNGLNMGRRRSLDQKELDLLKAECAKLKLTLPEIIEPTTTERFFAPAENSN